jgi:hypothetical protein
VIKFLAGIKRGPVLSPNLISTRHFENGRMYRVGRRPILFHVGRSLKSSPGVFLSEGFGAFHQVVSQDISSRYSKAQRRFRLKPAGVKALYIEQSDLAMVLIVPGLRAYNYPLTLMGEPNFEGAIFYLQAKAGKGRDE